MGLSLAVEEETPHDDCGGPIPFVLAGACPHWAPSVTEDVGLHPHCHSSAVGFQPLVSRLELIQSRENNYSVILLWLLKIETILLAFKRGRWIGLR